MNITINVIKLSNIVDKDFEFQWAQDFQNNLLKGNQKSPRTRTHTPRLTSEGTTFCPKAKL
jgi:hypothetical protein